MLRRGMLGRLLKLWFRLWNLPLGRRSTTVYDLAGQVTVSMDTRGHRTRSAHGSAGQAARRAGCAILFRISRRKSSVVRGRYELRFIAISCKVRVGCV